MNRPLLAAAVTLFTMLSSTQARADNWGCEVLLCLSNPAGPMAVRECVPPIKRLYRAIFKWRPDPFPTCLMIDGRDTASGGNYAYVAPASYYDACPSGMSPAGVGQQVAKGRLASREEVDAMPSWMRSSVFVTSAVVAGVGEGHGISPSRSESTMPAKVCVASYLGSTIHALARGSDEIDLITVDVFDRVVVMDPAADTFNINVMIDGGLFRNIRPFSAPVLRDL